MPRKQATPTPPTSGTNTPATALMKAAAAGHRMTPYITPPDRCDPSGSVADAVACCTRRLCRARLAYWLGSPDPDGEPQTVFVDLSATLTCVTARWTRAVIPGQLRQERRQRRRQTEALAAGLGHELGPWQPQAVFNHQGFSFVRECRRCAMHLLAHVHPFRVAADDIPLERETGGTAGAYPCPTIQHLLFTVPYVGKPVNVSEARPTPLPPVLDGQGRLFD